MKIKFCSFLLTLLFSMFISSIFGAQKPLKNSWQILFNGKNLDGWKQLNGKHIWEVKDGIIVGTTVPGEPNGFLCTEKEFGDFILEIEVSIDTLMNNSGVQFRSLSYPGYQNGRVHGYQMEVDPKPQQWSGAIYEEGGNRGWIFTGEQLSNTAKKAFLKDQKNGYRWNKYRIECMGTTIRTWINGIPTAHLVDGKFLRGFIGLQLHANQANDPAGSYQVRFRNIRIQTGDLTPSSLDDAFVVNTIPNHLSSQEEKNGYSLLWDGYSTKGWRGASKTKFTDQEWEIKDGVLNSVNGEDIMTEREYDSFELKFDFKLTQGANGGIKYFVTESNNNKPAASFSPEYQIVDDAIPDISGTQTLGSLTDLLESKKTRASIKKIGDWNQGIIKVLPNNQVEYWLNGYKILEYQRGSAEYLDLIAKSKYKDLPNFGMVSKGHILLEAGVSYRSIKIKELN